VIAFSARNYDAVRRNPHLVSLVRRGGCARASRATDLPANANNLEVVAGGVPIVKLEGVDRDSSDTSWLLVLTAALVAAVATGVSVWTELRILLSLELDSTFAFCEAFLL
jgi:hypothetical protein